MCEKKNKRHKYIMNGEQSTVGVLCSMMWSKFEVAAYC